jgi:hypothetical protein
MALRGLACLKAREEMTDMLSFATLTVGEAEADLLLTPFCPMLDGRGAGVMDRPGQEIVTVGIGWGGFCRIVSAVVVASKQSHNDRLL